MRNDCRLMTSAKKSDPMEAELAQDGTAQVRHRMANTLQLLSALGRMRGQKAADAETRRQLLWMSDAVGSLGALDRHRQGLFVDFAAYLDEMTPIWRRRHGGTAQLQLNVQPILVSDTTASTLALVTQELVGNALAHGFSNNRPGQVNVRLTRRNDTRCELIVSDDGQGFDPASPLACERFGLWFVRSLAAQVRGEFTVISEDGTTARLVFSG